MSKLNYTQAFEELQTIVAEMENGKISVDELAIKVKRASELIRVCKNKLTETEDENSVKRYHDSLITNATELCGLLTHLNITKDPKLEEARKSLELTMLGVDIEDIKEHADVRSNVKNKVDEILNKFNW